MSRKPGDRNRTVVVSGCAQCGGCGVRRAVSSYCCVECQQAAARARAKAALPATRTFRCASCARLVTSPRGRGRPRMLCHAKACALKRARARKLGYRGRLFVAALSGVSQ